MPVTFALEKNEQEAYNELLCRKRHNYACNAKKIATHLAHHVSIEELQCRKRHNCTYDRESLAVVHYAPEYVAMP